jgi:PAS domain S-box-containing protein
MLKAVEKVYKWLHSIWHTPVLSFSAKANSREEDLKKIICLLEKIADLRKRDRMYTEFWNAAHECFMLVRCDNGRILDVNNAACALYGYTKEEFLKLSFLEDITAEPECTRTTAIEKFKYVPARNHKKRGGDIFMVSAHLSYFNDQGYDVCAIILNPFCNRANNIGLANFGEANG